MQVPLRDEIEALNDEPRISAETTNFYAYVLKILIWSLSFLFQLLPWVETPFVRYLIP